MPRHSLHPLRRSRALLVWAMVAWLALVGMAWGQTDCCSGAAPASHSAHAHGHQHGGTVGTDCDCVHALAALPAGVAFDSPLIPRLAQSMALTVPAAPQPDYAPPLRPPLPASA